MAHTCSDERGFTSAEDLLKSEPRNVPSTVGYCAVIHGLYMFAKDFIFIASYASSSWGASIIS